MANEYRLKETGEIKTKEELIVANSNISFPKIWDDSVLEILNVDEVLNGSKPTVSGPYKHIVRDGEIQTMKANGFKILLNKICLKIQLIKLVNW